MNRLIIDGYDTGVESIDFCELVKHAKSLAREFSGSTVEIVCEGVCIFRYYVIEE